MNPGGVYFYTEAVIQEMSGDLNVQIRDHKTQSFSFSNPGMEGKVEMRLAAAGGGEDPEFGFGPLTMFQFVFAVGPVPVRSVAKVQTVARLTVHSQASGTDNSTISFSGTDGDSFDCPQYR